VLLVVDVQNVWLPMMADADRTGALEEINRAIAFFREREWPVIAVYHTDPQRGPEPGTEPFEFPESVAITPDDFKLIKNYPSAFTGTELTQLLKDQGRDTVILCGLSATGCVLATYYGAMDRQFTVVMLRESLLSPDASHTDVIQEICQSATLEELRELFP
jgi:nicotinamidase-related amidase